MALDFSSDRPLQRVLKELGAERAKLLGFGGEACVFEYGDGRIIRIHHALVGLG